MRARTTGTIAAIGGLALVAACAAEQTVSSFVQGSWTCVLRDAYGSGGELSVEVDDGTYAVTSDQIQLDGTWEIAFGQLDVTIDGGSMSYRGGSATSLPGADESPVGFSGEWTARYDDSADAPGLLDVAVEDRSVRITHESEGHTTTTTCSHD